MSPEGYDPSASGSMAGPDPMIGQVLDGRYRVLDKLGEGGMGEVYAAEHVHIEKKVAIKLLRGEIVTNKEAVSRFRQEARSASSIGHKNIIAIEDFGTIADGRIYLCMEFLEGSPFNDLISQNLSTDRLLNILIQTGHGLAAAHAKDIVHRDMKPENIFVTSGDVPKLLDFGIAKVSGADGENHLTRTGTIFGTPFYMAPEQALGQAVDHRADIYAMGVIMYEVFTGSIPFQGESFMGILTQHITAEPKPCAMMAQEHGKVVPPGIENIIVRAMKKEPEDRFQTMDALVQELVSVYRGNVGSGMSSYMEAHVPASAMMATVHAPASGSMPIARPPAQTPMPGHGPPQHRPPSHGSQPNMMPPGHVPGSGPYANVPSRSAQHSAPMHPQHFGSQPHYPAPGSSVYDVPRKSNAMLLIVILLVLGLGGGGAAFYFLVVAKEGATASNEVDAGARKSADASSVTVGKLVDAGSVAATADASSATIKVADAGGVTPVAPDASVVESDQLVRLRVKSSPSGATVYKNGRKIGKTPLSMKLKPGQTATLKLERAGYLDQSITVGTTKKSYSVALTKKEVVTPPKTACEINPSSFKCKCSKRPKPPECDLE